MPVGRHGEIVDAFRNFEDATRRLEERFAAPREDGVVRELLQRGSERTEPGQPVRQCNSEFGICAVGVLAESSTQGSNGGRNRRRRVQ